MWGLAILILAGVVAPAPVAGQPAAPAADPPAQAGESAPADPPETAPKKGPEKGPEKAAEPLQPPAPWSDEIARVAKKRYPEGVADLRLIETQVQAIVKHARPAVVGVEISGSVGSGVIVSEDGLVLTAGHVVMKPNQPVRFRFPDGKRVRGVTLGMNSAIDSGMMRITDKGPWPHLKVADAESLEAGDWVIGMGQPNGFFRDRAPPVRLGRVLFENDEVINTDCTLVGGDSGGPLLNLKGEVVGIHSRIGRRITSNFHVPISTYASTWDRLLAGEAWGGRDEGEQQARYRPVLGVTANPRETPCRVTQVFPGFPAEQAGVKVGDVITHFEDNQIESFSELARLVLAERPGKQVKLAVSRDGKPLVLRVRLGRVIADFPGAPPLESSAPAP